MLLIFQDGTMGMSCSPLITICYQASFQYRLDPPL